MRRLSQVSASTYKPLKDGQEEDFETHEDVDGDAKSSVAEQQSQRPSKAMRRPRTPAEGYDGKAEAEEQCGMIKDAGQRTGM